jgi:hypothetical protein
MAVSGVRGQELRRDHTRRLTCFEGPVVSDLLYVTPSPITWVTLLGLLRNPVKPSDLTSPATSASYFLLNSSGSRASTNSEIWCRSVTCRRHPTAACFVSCRTTKDAVLHARRTTGAIEGHTGPGTITNMKSTAPLDTSPTRSMTA